jgi:hypothetical protein
MAIVQTACTSYKLQLLNFVQSDTYYIALYNSTAILNGDTAIYTPTGEVSGPGYVPGGIALTVVPPASDSGVAFMSFLDAVFPAAVTARGALIYDVTQGNMAVAVLDFGADKTSASSFTVTFPIATSSTAIIRVG